MEPLITIIHPTARVSPSEAFPDGWREVRRVAFDRCDHPERVEYLLGVHESRVMEISATQTDEWDRFSIVRYAGMPTCVRGANACAEQARGKLLVILQDDMFPPDHWDTLLINAGRHFSLRQYVIHVSSASPSGELPARNDDLFNPQILTRARYERLGYIGWPGYTSMFADDELSEHARRDGCVIDARQIVFEHRHPIFGEKSDAVYEEENRKEAYEVGFNLFTKRAAAGFPGLKSFIESRVRDQRQAEDVLVQPQRPLIGVCTPGQTFSNLWVDSWTKLFGHLIVRGWNVVNMFGYSTSVHVARMSMADHMGTVKPRPDFLLWIDDDNLLTIEQFEMLVASLQAAEKEDPNVQIVAGWCWMKCEDLDALPKVSCGWQNANGGNVPMPYSMMEADPHDLIEIEWSGFPVVLMRMAAIERAGGPGAFLPYLDPRLPWGFLSEDMAFSRRYREAGGRMLVDRRVKVPHLKLQPAEPRGVAAAPVIGSMEDGPELEPVLFPNLQTSARPERSEDGRGSKL